MPGWNDFEILPFAPGASPFRIKGVAYRAHVDYVREKVPGGEAAVAAVFGNPALAAFFGQTFLASSWYDALPMMPVWYATARALGIPAVEFLRMRTRHQAERDINGVYRLILKVASAETVALRIPRLLAQYFDFGTSSASVVRPGVIHLEHAGIPQLLAGWFAIVGDAYLRVALEIAGARGFSIARLAPTPSGTAHGVPLVKVAGELQLPR